MSTNSTPATRPGVVTLTRVFAAPVEKVWHALTDADAIRQWSFPVSGFRPEVGFQFQFTCGDQGMDFIHHCRVTEAVPLKRLAYTWRYEGYEGDSLVTIELFAEGNQTKVTLTHTGLDTFPPKPFFAANNFNAGWTDILGNLLKNFVEKSDTADREVVITRLVSAPRDLVWQTFTDPKHVTNWWGPRGFRTTTHAHDLRPGGIWRYTMHGPDGTDYPNEMIYHEVVAPERLSYSHGTGSDDYPHSFEVVTTFATEGEQTRITMRSVFKTAASRDYIVKEFGAIEGGIQTMDRFEEQLAFAQAGEAFTLTRTFAAPRDRVWAAFTQAEHLMHWWGPKSFTMKTAKVDLRPGGTFHYGMQGPGGEEMWGKFTYREVAAPERLVFVLSFSDQAGNTAPHPGHPTWPLEMLKVITFTEADGQTTVTLRGVAFKASAEARQTYRDGHESMRGGFGASWDQLAEYLAKTK